MVRDNGEPVSFQVASHPPDALYHGQELQFGGTVVPFCRV